MCTAPSKIDCAVLIVPAGINNSAAFSTVSMLIPLIQYQITKEKKYLIKSALYVALKEKFLDEDTMDVLKDSFDNVKIKAGMPTNIPEKKYTIILLPHWLLRVKKTAFFLQKK